MTREDFHTLEFNVNRSLEDWEWLRAAVLESKVCWSDIDRRFRLLRAHIGALANLVEVEREFQLTDEERVLYGETD